MKKEPKAAECYPRTESNWKISGGKQMRCCEII